MVDKFLSLLHKEFKNINQAALLLGLFSVLSQILGLVRDRLLAHYLGAGKELDLYYAAFRIPDFLYVSIASFVSVTVLIPFLMEYLGKNEEGKENARKFIGTILQAFVGLMCVVSLILFITMPALSRLLFPGFVGADHDLLVMMSRIMLLSPLLLGVSNLFGSVTQIYKKYFLFSLSPVFYNVGILIGIVFFLKWCGTVGLVIGVILGAVLHMILQIPVLVRHGLIPRFPKMIDTSMIKRVAIVSLPRTVGLALNSISITVLIAFGSLFEKGSISVFNFAYTLQTTPLMIIGISYSVAAFPVLAEYFSKNERTLFLNHIVAAFRQVIFWSLPFMFLFIVLRAQIVRILLGSGAFSWSDTRLTAAALALFSISILAQSAIHLFVRGYYAAGQTKRPLIVNFASSIIIVLSAIFFSHVYDTVPFFKFFLESLLRVEDIAATKVLVLPLAYSVGTITNALILWRMFKKDFVGATTRGLFTRPLLQHTAAGFFMGFTAYAVLDIFGDIFPIDTFYGIFFQGFCAGIAGILVGVLLLYIFDNTELKEFISTLRSKFWKTRVVAPEQPEL